MKPNFIFKLCKIFTSIHEYSKLLHKIRVFILNLLSGLFTQIINEETGDRRLLVLTTHQGGCNHATKYKYKYRCISSKLSPIKK